MSGNRGKRDRNKNDQDQPRKDYLGRILIGFIIAAAILWTLTFLL